ncbi:MAG: ABC transporter ATP-binding protein [Acidobacteriota bacterium]
MNGNHSSTSTGAGTPAPQGAHEMIRLEDVSKLYRTDRIETVALSDVRLGVERGEFVSIMGPSGCGKSTLLHLMGLLDRPSTGSIEVAGLKVNGENGGNGKGARNGAGARDRDLARARNRHIGFIFQSFHLISDLRVVDNVEIPLLYRGMSGAERSRRALAALDRVGLSSRAHHFPSQLSGGQQQRVAIARAISGEPELLLADEPTGNLDSHMGDEVMQILEELNRAGTTIVMVTHDPRMAERTHRTVRLFDGRQVN